MWWNIYGDKIFSSIGFPFQHNIRIQVNAAAKQISNIKFVILNVLFSYMIMIISIIIMIIVLAMINDLCK